MRRKHDFSGKLNPRAEEEVFGGRLYKGGARSGANNAKSSGKRSSGIAVPYQPVRGGARVLGTKNAANTTKGGTLKLKLKKASELWVKILHPKDRERVLAGHNRARRTGTPFREEYRLVARDGSEVWVRGEAAPIVTGDGKPRQRAGMILDITDRKRHEGNLKRRGGRFRELLENAMEGIAQIAPEGGIIEQCNSAYARILCLTPKEAVGRSFFEFVEGEDEREARHQRELRISGTGSKYEVSITAADGKRKVLSCGGYPLLGADGSYEGAVQTVFDVTELRERERALRASEEMSGGLSRQRGSE